MHRTDTDVEQLTHDGQPLYTFRADGAGDAKGDNVSDEFGGIALHWRAAVVEPQVTTVVPGGAGVGGMGS